MYTHIANISEEFSKALNIFKQTGAFIRLDTRSPKDAIFHTIHFHRLLKENSIFASTPSQKLLRFYQVLHNSMKIIDADTAMDLLLMSDRVAQDLRQCQNMNLFPTFIVIRQFSPALKPEFEFRLFVWDGVLTACSAYHKHLYIPHLHLNKTKLASVIKNYWELHINPKLGTRYHRYTLDLVVVPTGADYDITVIELNHPPPVADTCLFDFSLDKIVLTNGPFQLRVVESESTDALQAIPKEVQTFF